MNETETGAAADDLTPTSSLPAARTGHRTLVATELIQNKISRHLEAPLSHQLASSLTGGVGTGRVQLRNMLRSFPPSFSTSANPKFKPLDPMSKDQLELQAKDGTIQCDHPTCKEPLDPSLCTDRCVVVECDAGVVNEQCEQGCVVDRAYGCPYDKEETSFARTNDDVSITHHPKETWATLLVSLPSRTVQLSHQLRVYVLKIRPALIVFFPVLGLPVRLTSNSVLANKHPSQYRPCSDIHHFQSRRG